MKRFLSYAIILLALCASQSTFAQVTGTFTVQGDGTKFYPVIFYDGGWDNNIASELEIGRSIIHKNPNDWWGTIIAKFRYHVTAWGHGSNFIDADIRQKFGNPNIALVGGWRDITAGNGGHQIMIWLRGSTPYYYKSDYAVNPVVYDGVANPVTYQEVNGPVLTFKTTPDEYVNPQGMSYQNTAYFNDPGVNFFGGKIGIGTTNPGEHRLVVEGSVAARRIKVTTSSTWADFVFDSAYKLPSLQEVESYVKTNKHLPEVPSAKEVKENGIDVGEMNKVLLQKIEELTLYIIELKKENEAMDKRLQRLEGKK